MGNIRVFGPRASGKTTYLAALACWSEHSGAKPGQSGSFEIQPLNEDTEYLARMAQDLLLEGASLPQTDARGGVDELPVYSFRIEPRGLFQKYTPINLVARDYSGEIFDDLAADSPNPAFREFMDECLTNDVEGCLILLTGWDAREDKGYSRSLRRFLELMEAHGRSDNLRIAVAMSKCERGEIWPGRHDPEIDLFQVHLPKTWQLLHSHINQKNLRFCALSTFGVLDRHRDPRPNREDQLGQRGRNSVLRKSNKWHPYGLISPLYWLSTGKEMRVDA